MGMRRPRRVSLDHRGGGAAAPWYRLLKRLSGTVLISIHCVHVRDDLISFSFLFIFLFRQAPANCPEEKD